ncbi:hypothetical protein PR202_ga04257 [Eleusine coracana subsp. coracana]|uniref:Uncharacterized protein n=1 Tax=Eleusine coracana subsp. coracana TaxID=191504 RepID=A0AAV5BR47_ELECO|nr:hypothetical protein PR202_ga04257 [Eleusine coracana subsp. coracana]
MILEEMYQSGHHVCGRDPADHHAPALLRLHRWQECILLVPEPQGPRALATHTPSNGSGGIMPAMHSSYTTTTSFIMPQQQQHHHHLVN